MSYRKFNNEKAIRLLHSKCLPNQWVYYFKYILGETPPEHHTRRFFFELVVVSGVMFTKVAVFDSDDHRTIEVPNTSEVPTAQGVFLGEESRILAVNAYVERLHDCIDYGDSVSQKDILKEVLKHLWVEFNLYGKVSFVI